MLIIVVILLGFVNWWWGWYDLFMDVCEGGCWRYSIAGNIIF